MLADKFVDLYARNSGLRDKLVAERDSSADFIYPTSAAQQTCTDSPPQ
jgi:hypothetical protein